jgi:hypothetical protein
LTGASRGSGALERWFTVNIRKIAGFLVIIFVLFWIISTPAGASGSVNKLMTNTKSAGTSIVTFMQNILGGSTTTGRTTQNDHTQ